MHGRITATPVAIALVAAGWLSACGGSPVEEQAAGVSAPAGPREGRPIPTCSPASNWSYLVRDAQQCWFHTPEGRWRIVSHEMHYDVLVMRIVADRLEAAVPAAARVAEVHGERFAEILAYVETEAPTGVAASIRRVRWTRAGGFEPLDFPAADGP